jgi:hypothetical protein
MGSTNPVFILPRKLASERDTLAKAMVGAINLGAFKIDVKLNLSK